MHSKIIALNIKTDEDEVYAQMEGGDTVKEKLITIIGAALWCGFWLYASIVFFLNI